MSASSAAYANTNTDLSRAAVEADAPSKSGSQKLRILLADGQPVVQEGIAALLLRQDGLDLVTKTSNQLRLSEYFAETAPDLVLFDPDFSDPPGIQEMLLILEKKPAARFIVFTSRHREEQVYRAVTRGASGYLLKTATQREIVDCITTVSKGGQWISPAARNALTRRIDRPDLTKREHDVLMALAEGMSNKEIGTLLNLREGTVKVHISHILGKLRVAKRTEAVSAAMANGLVTPKA